MSHHLNDIGIERIAWNFTLVDESLGIPLFEDFDCEIDVVSAELEDDVAIFECVDVVHRGKSLLQGDVLAQCIANQIINMADRELRDEMSKLHLKALDLFEEAIP